MARRQLGGASAGAAIRPPRLSRKRERAPAPLGPGLHLGRIEMVATSRSPRRDAGAFSHRYRVELQSGQRIAARLAPEVQADFAQQCLRESRTVLLVDTPLGPSIAGALQVACSPATDERGVLWLDARHVRLRAERSMRIEVPAANLTLDQDGMRLEGDKLIIDMAAIVRILTAHVDIP